MISFRRCGEIFVSQFRRVLIVSNMLLVSACASTAFVSTWKAPDAAPLQVKGAKVAAVVMMENEGSRRTAEDTLAREITARGAQGVAMYTIMPDAKPSKEEATRAALEKANVDAVVVMRPIDIHNKLEIKPATYVDSSYTGYWNGYYGHGWGAPWAGPVTIGTDINSTTTVTVETLVYSLKQNKL